MLTTVSKKHIKNYFLILCLILFGLAVVYFSYKYFTRDDSKYDANTVVVPVQTKEEIANRVNRSGQFRAIIQASNQGDDQKVIDLSYVFAKDTANNSISRLDAYKSCIVSSQNLVNSDMKSRCYEEGKKLANINADETIKSVWLANLDHAFNGTEPEISSDDGPQ